MRSRLLTSLAITTMAVASLSLGGCSADDTAACNAVTGFLTALSESRANDALAFSCTHKEGQYLTDAVLAAGNAANPIKIVSVGQPRQLSSNTSTYAAAEVRAEYTIGGQAIDFVYGVERRYQSWCLTEVTAQIVPRAPGLYLRDYEAGLPLTMNGVPFTPDDLYLGIDLFPGIYQLTVVNQFISTTGGQFVVPGPWHDLYSEDSIIIRGSVSLTDDAQRAIGQAAQQKLAGCLSETTAKTTCGFSSPLGSVAEIVTWSAAPPDFDLSTWHWNIRVTTWAGDGSYTDPFPEAYVPTMALHATVTDTKGRTVQHQEIVAIRANISDPNNIVITIN